MFEHSPVHQVNRNFRFPTSDKHANSPTPLLAQAVGAFPWSWLKLVHESGQFHRFVRAGSLLRTVCGPFARILCHVYWLHPFSRLHPLSPDLCLIAPSPVIPALPPLPPPSLLSRST